MIASAGSVHANGVGDLFPKRIKTITCVFKEGEVEPSASIEKDNLVIIVTHGSDAAHQVGHGNAYMWKDIGKSLPSFKAWDDERNH